MQRREIEKDTQCQPLHMRMHTHVHACTYMKVNVCMRMQRQGDTQNSSSRFIGVLRRQWRRGSSELNVSSLTCPSLPKSLQYSPHPSEVMETGEASFREQTQQGLPLSHSQGRGSWNRD